MSTTMSTPINKLPANIPNEVIQQNSSQLEDPTIADVINEMEREVQQQRPPPQNIAPPNMPHMQQPHVQHVFQQQYPIQYPHSQPQQYAQPQQQNIQYSRNFIQNNQYQEWINTPHAQRAILAAFIAAMIFYPFDSGAIYEKIPFFANAHQYDRLIRTLLLAVTLYVLLLKLNI